VCVHHVRFSNMTLQVLSYRANIVLEEKDSSFEHSQ
jgi:hypothetical protein